MIQTGNTIVVKNDNGTWGFYWLCDIHRDGYVFFDWFANPRKASLADYWVITKDWFENKVKDGTIEVYESLPEEYMDVFEQQAKERVQKQIP